MGNVNYILHRHKVGLYCTRFLTDRIRGIFTVRVQVQNEYKCFTGVGAWAVKARVQGLYLHKSCKNPSMRAVKIQVQKAHLW
jgi:hypothetical protein